MKRIYLKRALSLGLAMVMTVTAVGCGKKKTTGSDDASSVNHDVKNFVFKETDLDLGSDVNYNSISFLGKIGDKFYAAGSDYTDEGTVVNAYIINSDGKLDKTVKFDMDSASSMSYFAIAEDGSIYTIESNYGSSGYTGDFQPVPLFDETNETSTESGTDAGVSTTEGTSDAGTDASVTDSTSSTEDLSTTEDSTEKESSSDYYNVDDADTDKDTDTDSESDTDADAGSDSNDDSASIKGVNTPSLPAIPGTSSEAVVDTEGAESTESTESTESGTSEDAATTTSDSGDTFIVGGSDGSAEFSDDYSYSSSETYNLVKRDANGSELWRIQLNADQDADSYYTATALFIVEGKGIVVSDNSGIHLFSADDGSKIKDVDTSEYNDSDSGNYFQLFKKGDGSIVGALSTGEDFLFYTLDLDAGTVAPIENAKISQYKYTINSGAGYDLFLSDSEAIYGYNIGDQEPTMLMNYVDSDISSYGIYQIVGASEKSFLCLVPNDESYVLAMMNKVDPSDVKDKKTITLGCNYIDYDVRSQVVKFNKASDEYRIVISDYSKFDTEENNYSGGATKLNTDIVSGNVPDILVLDNDMPVDSYIAKGLFQDLTDYFTNDEDLKKINYLENVMNVFKTDGKMYKLIPSFYIETVAAATEDVGEVNTWTIDQLEKLVKDKNIEYKNIFGPLTREDVFDMALSLGGSQFIDWSKQKCSYNSDAFIHLLELVNEFPADLPEDDLYADSSAYWRDGKALAARFYLSGFSDYNYEAKGSYGKDISLVGFPSDNGSGAAIFPNLQLTISSTSSVKDGCWQFIRYFLTEEYQNTIDSSWPVSKDRVDALAEKAKKKPSYVDEETGKEVEYDDTWYIGETEIVIDPMTDDEVNKVIDYLGTVNQVGNYNDSIKNIIYEEAAAYFSGQKTAKEVADIIQSRVQIYVNEIS